MRKLIQTLDIIKTDKGLVAVKIGNALKGELILVSGKKIEECYHKISYNEKKIIRAQSSCGLPVTELVIPENSKYIETEIQEKACDFLKDFSFVEEREMAAAIVNWCDGYKAAKAEGSFSEEQVIRAYEDGQDYQADLLISTYNKKPSTGKEYVESLKPIPTKLLIYDDGEFVW